MVGVDEGDFGNMGRGDMEDFEHARWVESSS